VLAVAALATPASVSGRAPTAAHVSRRTIPGGVVSAPGDPFLQDARGRRLPLTGINLVPTCAATSTPVPDVAGTSCVSVAPWAPTLASS